MKMFLVFLLLIVLLYLITSNKDIINKESFSQDYYPHLYNSNIIPCKK